jgi:hypothetical protein
MKPVVLVNRAFSACCVRLDSILAHSVAVVAYRIIVRQRHAHLDSIEVRYYVFAYLTVSTLVLLVRYVITILVLVSKHVHVTDLHVQLDLPLTQPVVHAKARVDPPIKHAS